MITHNSRRLAAATWCAPQTTLPRSIIGLVRTPFLTSLLSTGLTLALTLTLPLVLGLTLLPTGCANADTHTGKASYYHDKFHGRRTASGAVYNRNLMTAAHKHLPLGTEVRVTDVNTGRSVEVVINDRGPFVKGRVIDLSRRAATELGMIKRGTAPVRVEVLSRPGRRSGA